MELRKDPLTRSWVITGDHPERDRLESKVAPCAFCAGSEGSFQVVGSMPPLAESGGNWSAKALVHPAPILRIEGDPQREGDGIYDRMRAVGAHELLLENPKHDRHLWVASDAEIEAFILLAAHRVHDLKRDSRFKYVNVLKNYGAVAGQDFAHPSSQITATTFVPRRVLHELRASREYFAHKERCVFCDILHQEQEQEKRMVEQVGDFAVFCPYASRSPYELWLMPQTHSASFESTILNRAGAARDLGRAIRRALSRIRTITESFHLVIHTQPNTTHKSEVLQYWKTIDEDFHWHIEVLPILSVKSKPYIFKEIYYSPVTPESAAVRLREAPIPA